MQKIHVITFADADNAQEAHVVIDHDDFEMRKWLGRHQFWCVRNGRTVMTMAAAPTEQLTKQYASTGPGPAAQQPRGHRVVGWDM